VVNANDVLVDHRPVVELLGDIVCGRPDQLDAPIPRPAPDGLPDVEQAIGARRQCPDTGMSLSGAAACEGIAQAAHRRYVDAADRHAPPAQFVRLDRR
jgi:hypothetical protein